MREHGRIIGCFGGCHCSGDSFLGKAIIFFTTWPSQRRKALKTLHVSTHSSMGFIYEDGYREYYEAREGKKGWLGPYPVSKAEAWVAENPEKRRFTMYDIPMALIGEHQAVVKKVKADKMKKQWKYSIFQLLRMGIRKYLPWLPINRTKNWVVCSEAATVLLDYEAGILNEVGVEKPDLVTPYQFEQALKRICT